MTSQQANVSADSLDFSGSTRLTPVKATRPPLDPYPNLPYSLCSSAGRSSSSICGLGLMTIMKEKWRGPKCTHPPPSASTAVVPLMATEAAWKECTLQADRQTHSGGGSAQGIVTRH